MYLLYNIKSLKKNLSFSLSLSDAFCPSLSRYLFPYASPLDIRCCLYCLLLSLSVSLCLILSLSFSVSICVFTCISVTRCRLYLCLSLYLDVPAFLLVEEGEVL